MSDILNRPDKKALRQELRSQIPTAEVILWSRLRGRRVLGKKFRRQYSVGPYVLDFYCPEVRLAVEVDGDSHCLPDAARQDRERQAWVERRCDRLKHQAGAAARLLAELRALQAAGVGETHREDLAAALTYFQNHQHQMPYAERVAAHLPIGSGVTEAACKTLVKMRMCRSGAKWKTKGAGVVLSLRALSYSAGRWEQFWAKVDQYGFPIEMAA